MLTPLELIQRLALQALSFPRLLQAIPGATSLVILRPQPGLPIRSFAALPLPTGQRVAAHPPPHTHRHRYHGVLEPNATLRAAVTALAREASNGAQQQTGQEKEGAEDAAETLCRSPARYLWAMLLARIYESAPLACPQCGADMRIIAFVTDGVSVRGNWSISASLHSPHLSPRHATALRNPASLAYRPKPSMV